MSVGWRRLSRSVERGRLAAARGRCYRVVFGDDVGAALFLGALAFFALYWRTGVFINDTYTVANAMVAVSDGHLAITRIAYGPASGATPGMHLVDGRLYGRNYGQVFFALPILWLLRAVAAVADVRLALVGAWCAAILGCLVLVGRATDRRQLLAPVGAVAALLLFALNAAVATDLAASALPYVALQLASMLAAAFTGVFLYRLVAAIHARRVGVAVGVATVVATPVGFWASLPKRHVTVAALVAIAAYAFYRSRVAADRGDERTACRFRAATYGALGLMTWVQPAEALVLFLVAVPVDLATARRNDPRTLGLVALCFGASLLPFLLTNAAISGNPFVPPRLLPDYEGGVSSVLAGQSGRGEAGGLIGPFDGGGSELGGERPGSDGGSRLTSLLRIASSALHSVVLMGDYLRQGVRAVVEPTRLYHVFVRSGYLGDVSENDLGEAISLTLLESMPLVAGLVALPAALRGRLSVDALRRPTGATDALVGGWLLLFTLYYLPRLPLHAMVTLRYLVPVMPLFLYALARLPAIRDALDRWRLATWSFVATTCIGGQLLVLSLLLTRPTLGEAVQLHALVNIAAGGLLVCWFLGRRLTGRPLVAVGGVTLGFVAAATTVFVLCSGVLYFTSQPVATTQFGLPLVERLSQLVPVV